MTKLAVAASGLLAVAAAAAQGSSPRWLAAFAANSSGTVLAAVVKQEGAAQQELVVALSPDTGKERWRFEQHHTLASIAVSPDGRTVAVGLMGVDDTERGVLFLDAHTGKLMGGLGSDPDSYFVPGVVHPQFGDGVSQLMYSSDGSLLYGLSDDTLFVWDFAAHKYLWNVDVPALIQAPPELPHALLYGHATDFTLSPDGRQIAALRDVLRIAPAGRTKPKHFIKRQAPSGLDISYAAFSADSRILAAGENGIEGTAKTPHYATDLWIDGALKAVHLDGCGASIAWTGSPDVFGCQDSSGAHLRNVHNLQINIGAPGPAGDLPLLKVGNSLWSLDYRREKWTDPAKPLTVTLGELGTGRRITLSLPGR